jgi:hypothetical protein
MKTRRSMPTGRDCANHPGLAAAVVCGICGKPVCGQCAVDVEGWTLCDDAQHKALLNHWSVLFVSDSEFETDIIKKNLELNGFAARIFTSRVYKEDIGEPKGEFVTLFVSQSEFEKAENVLKEFGLREGVQETNNQ